jgi:hypothetical protein
LAGAVEEGTRGAMTAAEGDNRAEEISTVATGAIPSGWSATLP